MYAPNYNAIFFHINKCAGTSVERALGVGDRYHRTVQVMQTLVASQVWDNAFRFSIVRNPWDRMVSMYRWRIERRQNIDGELTFPEWIRYADAKEKPHAKLPFFGPQKAWLVDKRGNFGTHVILRFENLSEEWDVVQEALGCPDLELTNTTTHAPYTEYYDPASIATVGKWHAEDVAQWGYYFGQ